MQNVLKSRVGKPYHNAIEPNINGISADLISASKCIGIKPTLNLNCFNNCTILNMYD